MDEFKRSLYVTLSSISKGRVISYGQLARLCGYPHHARHVGKALSLLPKESKLPWFRVVNSQGEISLTGEAFERQKQHLENEGVKINDVGKIGDFKKIQY